MVIVTLYHFGRGGVFDHFPYHSRFELTEIFIVYAQGKPRITTIIIIKNKGEQTKTLVYGEIFLPL